MHKTCRVLCPAKAWRMPGEGIWHMAYGIWYVAYGIWHMVCGTWHMVCGIWHGRTLRCGEGTALPLVHLPRQHVNFIEFGAFHQDRSGSVSDGAVGVEWRLLVVGGAVGVAAAGRRGGGGGPLK